MRISVGMGIAILLLATSTRAADEKATPLAIGVRGLATRTRGPVAIDGRLDEWAGAFCTPVHYNHVKLDDRAAQFLYLWDDRALYIGLRALDRNRVNVGNSRSLWDGDAVEFYLDTRSGDALRAKDWSPGSLHIFFTPFTGSVLKPRWSIRQGIATVTKLQGIELAATVGGWGYDVELAIPWANFPEFAPKPGALIAIDAELCSGDVDHRSDRTFAYGSPLSVQQPASQGLVELVEAFDPSYLPAVGPAAFPMWVDTPWVQPSRARCQAVVAIPPGFVGEVGEVLVRLHGTDGAVAKTLPAAVSTFGPSGLGFARALADWPNDEFAPGSYFATALVKSKDGKTLATVAPRMVAEVPLNGR